MVEETSTITLKRSTKERLESLMGERDWNTFLEELSRKRERKKA